MDKSVFNMETTLLSSLTTIIVKPCAKLTCFPAPLRTYPPRFGLRTVELLPNLKANGEGCPNPSEEELKDMPTGPQIFEAMGWESDINWDDVGFKDLLVYLKGNKNLALSPEWKAVFPRHI